MHMSESESGSDLCLLTTCADPAEASEVRSLLDADDILCVVQGEHHHGMFGPEMGGALIEIRVLVAWRDLERARDLLASEVETPEQRAAALAAGVEEEAAPPCPVHGEVSTAVCVGCDTFLCARCDTQGSPPLCEDCQEHKSPVAREPWHHRRQVIGWMVLALVTLFGARVGHLFRIY